tara:strand:+ start:2414 stop:2773 length:360 start_codon:yes stop_codon:yes gene_type:complete
MRSDTTQHKDKNVAAGWSKDKPHTVDQRKKILNKNKSCFLRPQNMKYPVCDVKGNYDCRGIIAAKFWADTAETKHKKKLTRKKRPYSFKKVSNNATKLGKKLGCKVFTRRKSRSSEYQT